MSGLRSFRYVQIGHHVQADPAERYVAGDRCDDSQCGAFHPVRSRTELYRRRRSFRDTNLGQYPERGKVVERDLQLLVAISHPRRNHHDLRAGRQLLRRRAV